MRLDNLQKKCLKLIFLLKPRQKITFLLSFLVVNFFFIKKDQKIYFSFSLFLSLQQGYFRTSKGSYFIEPIEEYVDENKNILHLLYRHPPVDGNAEKCDVTNSHGECSNLEIYHFFIIMTAIT